MSVHRVWFSSKLDYCSLLISIVQYLGTLSTGLTISEYIRTYCYTIIILTKSKERISSNPTVVLPEKWPKSKDAQSGPTSPPNAEVLLNLDGNMLSIAMTYKRFTRCYWEYVFDNMLLELQCYCDYHYIL